MAGHTVIVSVLADTKKFSRAFNNLSREIGLSKLGNGFKTVGSKIGGMAKTAAKATGAIAAGIAALAIKGGFERAMKIEDAQAKLKGLGHDAKNVDQIMADALASVKGTAYGLDTAATTAATAVAAGIKPGQDLEKYLRLTADAATIAGVNMDEMGSIMNKVAAKGKVSAREINQFTERGIPILQMLAEEYQVTAEEMSKMVSSGEVDAERFRKALEEGVGGAALESGNTTRGAFANMKAALSRVGVALLDDVFPMFRDMFNGITDGLDHVTDAVKPVGEAVSQWIEQTALPAVKRFGGWIRDVLWPVIRRVAETLTGAFKAAIDTIKGALERAKAATDNAGQSLQDTLLGALETVAGVIAIVIEKIGSLTAWFIDHRETIKKVAVAVAAGVGAFMAINKVLKIVKASMAVFNAVMAANPITLVVAAVAALVAGLVWFFTQTEIGQKIIQVAWEGIKTAISAVVEWWQTYVAPVIETVWEAIKIGAQAVADWFNTHLVPVFQSVGELLGAVFERIAQWASWLWDGFKTYLGYVIAFWEQVWGAIQAVWDVIGPPLLAYIQTGFEVLWTVLTTIWDNIKNVIETVLGVIRGIIDTVTALIQGDWQGAWEAIKGIGETVWNGIKRFIDTGINAIRNIISSVVEGIKRMWGDKWNAVKTTALNIFENIKTGVSDKLQAMEDFIRGIPDNIKRFFSNAGSWLLDAGRNIINGLWNGLKNKWEDVKGWFSGLGGWITDNKGPKAYDLALLVPAGRWIMQGLQTGLAKEIPNLKRTLSTVADTVVSTPFEPLQASLDSRQIALESADARETAPVSAEFSSEQFEQLRAMFREVLYESTSSGIRAGFGDMNRNARLSSVIA